MNKDTNSLRSEEDIEIINNNKHEDVLSSSSSKTVTWNLMKFKKQEDLPSCSSSKTGDMEILKYYKQEELASCSSSTSGDMEIMKYYKQEELPSCSSSTSGDMEIMKYYKQEELPSCSSLTSGDMEIMKYYKQEELPSCSSLTSGDIEIVKYNDQDLASCSSLTSGDMESMKYKQEDFASCSSLTSGDIEIMKYNKREVLPSSSYTKTGCGDKNSFDMDKLKPIIVESPASDGEPNHCDKSCIKPKKKRLTPLKTDRFAFRPPTPAAFTLTRYKPAEVKYSLPSSSVGTKICESSSNGEIIKQTNLKQALKPLAGIKLSAKSEEPPNPPEILNTFEAKAQVEGLVKPIPVVLSAPEQLEKDLHKEQLNFSTFVQLCNSLLLSDIRKNQLIMMQNDSSRKNSTVTNKYLSVPLNTSELGISTQKISEDVLKVTKSNDDLSCSTTEETNSFGPIDNETFSFLSNALQEASLKQPEPTTKELERCNYVMVAPQDNDSTKPFDGKNKFELHPNTNEIPSNDTITLGEMQVTKFKVYECIDLLRSVIHVFNNKNLLKQTDNACATPKIDVEKNIIACINILVSFIGDHREQDSFKITTNKDDIFVDAKEKCTVLLKSPKCSKKNIGTQVNSTKDVKKRPIPIPKITVTKPKFPSPRPSPYHSPKLNKKYKEGNKYCKINDPSSNEDLYTKLEEIENTTTGTITRQPQQKVKSGITEEMVNSRQIATTSAYVNSRNFIESTDSRLNKASLSTFSPKVAKKEKQVVILPKVKIDFHDDSRSPYEPPKSMMPLGTTKAFSISLSNARQTIPGYGEIDDDNSSVNSITTVTDEIVFTDLTKQNNESKEKQRSTQVSPLYWVSNHQETDIKSSSFRNLLSKVAKPFKKSSNIEKKNPSKSFELKSVRVKPTENYDGNASATDQLDVACFQEMVSPSGRSLKVPSAEECKRRNRNFEAWLDAQNDKLRAEKSQSNSAENGPNIEKKTKDDSEDPFSF